MPPSSARSIADSLQARHAFELVSISSCYRGFADAFRKATGLPITLLPVNTGVGRSCMSEAQPDKPANESIGTLLERLPGAPRCGPEFCRLVSQTSAGGVACRKFSQQITTEAACRKGIHQRRCFLGLVELATPIFKGGQHVATLCAGRVFDERPKSNQWLRTVSLLRRPQQGRRPVVVAQPRIDDKDNGTSDKGPSLKRLARAWRAIPILDSDRIRAAGQLLEFLGRFLEERLGGWLVANGQGHSSAVTKAEAYIVQNSTERLGLADVARHVGLSPQHFCNLFRRRTGQTFTQFLARVRVEAARRLLRAGSATVAEIAFASGFNSLPTFNRVFKKMVGVAPQQFRQADLTHP